MSDLFTETGIDAPRPEPLIYRGGDRPAPAFMACVWCRKSAPMTDGGWHTAAWAYAYHTECLHTWGTPEVTA